MCSEARSSTAYFTGSTGTQRPTKLDILDLVVPVDENTFKFDEAVYFLKNWKRVVERGHLTRLLAKGRVIEGVRHPNATTYVFVWDDGKEKGIVLTRFKNWNKKPTIEAFEGSRHECLVVATKLAKKYSINIAN